MSPLPCINVTFPKVKLTFVNVTVKNVIPAGKTICAESAPFVVVGFPYTACIIFIKIFIEHDYFSPNALKTILCENQAPS